MQAVLRIEDLPSAALDAAARFHERYLKQARAALDGEAQALVLVFPPAPHDHADWRRTVTADLARSAAPKRVNAVASGDGQAIETALAYLAAAPGITGQLLALDSTGAGNLEI